MPTYNGIKYDKNTDYAKLMNDAEAAGDLSAAKSYEQARNAKILGEGMTQFSTTNKYQNTGTNYDSKWSGKLYEILDSYEEAIKAPTTSLPSYTAPSYNSQYDAQIDDLLNKLLNREPFEYNEELDPLYQQYKDMYTKQGQLAMEDTMGQAAALTGGYGSTYSQAVGQQMYNAYLGKVQEMLPEFYDRAYSQYQDEGSNIKDLYNMYVNRDQLDFQRYQQSVANAQAEYEAAAAEAKMKYQQEQDKIGNIGNLYDAISGMDASDYQKFLDNWNMDNTLTQQDYEKKLQLAQLAAQYGDYSGLKTLGIDTSAYEATLATSGTGGGSSSGSSSSSSNNYYSKGSTVVNKATKETTSQPDSDSAALLAALYNGEITPTQYKEYLDAKNAQSGNLKAK